MKAERKRVYRETMDALLAQKGFTKQGFSEATGHTRSYYNTVFKSGYYNLTENRVALWASILGVSAEDITAIPVSKPVQPEPKEAAEEASAHLMELQEIMKAGFRMLHTDIRNLIETMDKYWKPEPPKYQVKDREQD